ncbi:hypothetical protein D7X33_12615 [Butyricicoccus sp. 1XD8-22]|nr:hypothetical protein D7X33_12615 [Butyricicoccus sp. 1XD8-22]
MPCAGSARGRCPLDSCNFFEKKLSKSFITPAGGTKGAAYRRSQDAAVYVQVKKSRGKQFLPGFLRDFFIYILYSGGTEFL